MKTKLSNYLWLMSISFILCLQVSAYGYPEMNNHPEVIYRPQVNNYPEVIYQPQANNCPEAIYQPQVNNNHREMNNRQNADNHKETDKQGNPKEMDKRDLKFGALLFSNARAEIGYATGRFIGIDRDYAEFGLFMPVPFFGTWLPFADARGYFFTDRTCGFSVGTGIRSLDFYDRIIGANVYFDFLQGKFGGSFRRLGLGVEWLGPCWDLRVNGYFPMSSHSRSKGEVVFNDYIGDFISICREEESATCEGFDAEIGVPLACWDKLNIYAGVGPYYYRTFFEHDYWGAQGRVEVNWSSYVSFQFRTSYDNVNRTQTQGKILVSIPFDFLVPKSNCHDCYQTIFAQPVKRNGIIFTDKCCIYTNNF